MIYAFVVQVQVAVKCLCKEKMQSGTTDFLKEATIMHSLEDEHIVRLYGVVLGNDSLMLVSISLSSLIIMISVPHHLVIYFTFVNKLHVDDYQI